MNHLKKISEKYSLFDYKRQYPICELQKLEYYLSPKMLEERWIVLFQSQKIYFYRAWTGECIFEVDLNINKEHINTIKAKACRDKEVYSFDTDEYDMLSLDELINDVFNNK